MSALATNLGGVCFTHCAPGSSPRRGLTRQPRAAARETRGPLGSRPHGPSPAWKSSDGPWGLEECWRSIPQGCALGCRVRPRWGGGVKPCVQWRLHSFGSLGRLRMSVTGGGHFGVFGFSPYSFRNTCGYTPMCPLFSRRECKAPPWRKRRCPVLVRRFGCIASRRVSFLPESRPNCVGSKVASDRCRSSVGWRWRCWRWSW